MKKLLVLILGIISISQLNAAYIKKYILDSSREFNINIAKEGTGATTIMFPGGIEGLNGSNITQSKDVPGAFDVKHNKGSYFLSVITYRKAAKGSINIVYNNNIYVLNLKTTSNEDSYSSVTFKSISNVISSKSGGTSPKVLQDIIKKARLYHLVKNRYPKYYEKVQLVRKNELFEYRAYDILLENIFRFHNDDTLVFQILIKNKTKKTLAFDPHLLSVRTGGFPIFYASYVKGSGKIPPYSESPVWFTITGNSDGGKNMLKPTNQWKVLLTAGKVNQKSSMLNLNERVVKKEEELKRKMSELNRRLNSETLTDRELEILVQKIEQVNKEIKQLDSITKITS
ncbi:MAG TPA: hypothetical protein QF753_07150 [Victivallales bacterium]|nr:hypothetical protein [Victivallales bacterium]